MANRRFRSQFRYGMEAMTVELFAVVDIGVSGAPTLSRGLGIQGIVRDSAGQYTITLQDKYNSLLHVEVMQNAGTSAMAAPLVSVEAEDVASAKTITLQYRAIDNSTPTDPADGEIQMIKLVLRNSSVS